MSILEPAFRVSTINFTKGDMEMMGWKGYVFICMLFVGLSCQKETRPQGLLNKAEMRSLMVEMYLAEAKIATARISRDSAKKLFKPYEKSVLERRGITDSTLKANYAYYMERPKELEQLLDAVIDTLSLREQRLVDRPN